MIVYFEDEEGFLDEYLEAVREAGYELVVYGRADSLLTYVRENWSDIDLFLLDIMVFGPGNEILGGEEGNGMNSGVALLDELEAIGNEMVKIDAAPSAPSVVFTNIEGPVLSELRGDHRVAMVIEKQHVFPSELVEILTCVIDGKDVPEWFNGD